MENGFNSPRTDAFPAGLRVLVVDDDPTWLKILEKMLKKCSYEVTTCGLARDALSLLRERKDGYDIVISDVNMPDMDGFKLLEHVGLEMDLPVIMMSVDGETSRVMKGVQHGACDYLLKPIRMKELRNIWQHVFRKKIHEVRDIELIEGMDSIQMARIGYEFSDDGHLFYGEDTTSNKKRKDIESKNDDKDPGDSSSSKKARVVWSVDLHQKFVKAVNQIGFDRVGPKKILDLMNVSWLTRENVASHLQKYRLYLSRLQKDNESKTSKHAESSLRESAGSFGTQNDISKGSYGFSSNSLFVQKAESRNFENERKGIVSKSTAKPKRALDVDVPRSSPVEFSHSFTSRRSDINFPTFDLKSPTQFSWSGIPQVEIKQEHKPLHLDEGFNSSLIETGRVSSVGPTINSDHVQTSHLSSAGPEINSSHIQTSHGGSAGTVINSSHVQTSHGSSSGTVINSSHVLGTNSIPKANSSHVQTSNPGSLGATTINPSHVQVNHGQSSHVSLPGVAINSSHVQTKMNAPNHQSIDLFFSANSASMKSQGFNTNRIDLDSAEKFLTWGTSAFPTQDDEMQFCLVQGSDCYAMNLGLQNIEFPEFYDPGINPVPEFQENLYDLSDYALMEQGLFIA